MNNGIYKDLQTAAQLLVRLINMNGMSKVETVHTLKAIMAACERALKEVEHE